MMVEDKEMKYPAEIMVFTYTRNNQLKCTQIWSNIMYSTTKQYTHCTQINMKITSIEISVKYAIAVMSEPA